MVLNEAAAAGLPLVATDDVGAAHDLIEDGASGFRIPSGDVEALCGRSPPSRGRRGVPPRCRPRSRELARRFTPEAWADGVASLAIRVARDASGVRGE